MNKNKEKVPKIRFPGFTEPWEQRKLGEIVDFLDEQRKPLESGKRESGPYPYYGASGIIDYVKDYIFYEELILLSEDGANIIDRNYRVCFLAQGKYWVNNHAHVLKAKKNYSNGFICESLERLNYDKYNTGTAQPKLNQEVCRNINIWVPKLDEQKKIFAVLNDHDNLITLHQRKLNHLKDKKKGLLQKMFPKKGELVPELRFPEFTDPWEQRKFGELVNQVIREVDKPDKPYWRLSVRSHAKGTFHQFVDEPQKVAMDKLYVVHEDDLVVNITFAWEHAIAVASKEDTGMLVSHRFPMYRADGKSDIGFLKYLVSQEYFRRKMDLISPGGAGRNRVLSKSEFLKIEVVVPCNKEEQQKIGEYFSNLDNLITLHQRKLDHLKEQKKALLQQMFI